MMTVLSQTVLAVICIPLLTGSQLIEECPAVETDIPYYITRFDQTCYMFMNREVYWPQARKECWRMGGELLSVKNEETMEFIKTQLDSRRLGWRNKGVWLGLHHTDKRGWRWTNGEKVTYSYWASGEPSKLLGLISIEDCGLMRRGDGWRWHDYSCQSALYHYKFICEFTLVKGPVKTSHAAHSSETIDNGNTLILALVLGIGGLLVVVLCIIFFAYRRHEKRKYTSEEPMVRIENVSYSQGSQPELPPIPVSSEPNNLYLTPVSAGARYECHKSSKSDVNNSTKDVREQTHDAEEPDELLGACGGDHGSSSGSSPPGAAAPLLANERKVNHDDGSYVDMKGNKGSVDLYAEPNKRASNLYVEPNHVQVKAENGETVPLYLNLDDANRDNSVNKSANIYETLP